MKIIGIIPARLGSSRFPGKPLKKINGKEMLLHVYENANESKLIDDLYIATCDNEIRDVMHSFGCKVVMTKNTHTRCTDRCAEALTKIESETNNNYEIVVMIQGDEPMVKSKQIDNVIQLLIDNTEACIANLVGKIDNDKDFYDKNTIKVCFSKDNTVIYFTN